MICNNCGSQLVEGSKFCSNCGAAIVAASFAPTAQTSLPRYRPGRGGLILTLGIIALVLTGPLTGIPAWIMGHRDIKRINAGEIASSERGLTNAGMILGIIGTVVGGIIIAVSIITIVALLTNRGW